MNDSVMNRRSKGSLLVITLWLVAILSMIAVAVARSLSLEVRLAKYRAARDRAKALARGGVYVAMERLAQDAQTPEADGKPYDWLGDDWAVGPKPPAGAETSWVLSCPGAEPTPASPGGQVTIEITDEERKLALNGATKEQLTRLGIDESLAQAIIDARDGPDPAEDRPSDTPPYFAKNGPFAAPEELADLAGVSPELLDALEGQTSPYLAEGGPVNLNTAPAQTLRALGLGENTIQLLLQFREGPDGPSAHEQDGVFREPGLAVLQALKDQQGVDLTGTPDGNLLISNTFGVTSQAFTVRVEGAVEHPTVRARVEAVVRRAGCGAGVPAPCIVAWRER